MTSLCETDRGLITLYPLHDSIGQFRKPLQDVERSNTAFGTFDGADDRSEADCQEAILRLLYTLSGTRAAYRIRSTVSSRNLISNLALLIERVRNGDFNYDHYRPLVKLIISEAPDFDIWSAVFDLIARLSRATPPASAPPAIDSTPITHSSASQQGSEQTRRLIDARVFEEIRGCTYRGVKGFFEKYFEGKDWTHRARGVYESIRDQYVDGKWLALPDSPTQDDVQSWLFRLQNNFLLKERRRYFTIKVPSELTGADTQRQIDLIIKKEAGEPKTSDLKHDWSDIEVIGELKASYHGVKIPLVQTARYVRDVFACQPTRRYIHAFTICGREMETWIFDRSGCYSPGPFNIHDEPEKFVLVIAGYIMMGEDELGLDTFREQDSNSTSIRVEQEGSETMKLQLKPDPLTFQRAIVGRGTSCYLTKGPGAKEWNCVTKFSWTSDRRKPEADLLTLANQRGVEGIARLVNHQSITNIKDMRRGLEFGKPYSFRDSQSASLLSRSFSGLHGLSIAESSGGRPQRKRKSPNANAQPSKRSRPESQRASASQNEITYAVQETQGTSLIISATDNQYDNRILRCLVIFPAGRPIHKYESISELLKALRDAIKAHRSLYSKGSILHRDISENNIIITDPEETGHAGMLIDMDLAKELGSGRSGARCRTGTMEFMAIQVLFNTDHTYRHDIESFFYVLIWQCAVHGWRFTGRMENRPRDSLLTRWYTGTFRNIARAKRGDMYIDGFEDVLEEFPEEFDSVKPLCRELREVLFPTRGGKLFTGTPKDPAILYEPILGAFDKTIDDIKAAAAG
ncbi:hypothetical protein FQN50_001005 [Emmonsiellopsis sp. PD_5]|nr:hypothetical protein FQN50_001005 [Emmonsiellopsis sp. PD_5]